MIDDVLTVQRQAGSCDRARSQRRLVDALQRAGEAAAAAVQGGDPGHELAADHDGLGTLKVGVRRHDHVALGLGHVDKSARDAAQFFGDRGVGVLGPQTEV